MPHHLPLEGQPEHVAVGLVGADLRGGGRGGSRSVLPRVPLDQRQVLACRDPSVMLGGMLNQGPMRHVGASGSLLRCVSIGAIQRTGWIVSKLSVLLILLHSEAGKSTPRLRHPLCQGWWGTQLSMAAAAATGIMQRLCGLLTHILAEGAASGNVLQGHDLHHKSQCKVATKLYTTS